MKRLIAHRINFLLPIISAVLFALTSCDVHEWPVPPEKVPFHLKLNYHTDMTLWEHLYDGEQVIESSLGPDTASVRPYGTMRYIIRAYPLNSKQRTSDIYTDEFILTKDIAEGYNNEVTLNLAPGDYKIMVWSDMIQVPKDNYFYKADDFSEITLIGDHTANTDYRDAFRGSGNITIISDIMERLPDTLSVQMHRPLGKYELITNDVMEFIQKEITRAEAKSKADGTEPDSDTKVEINIEDYKIVFYYVGFMPNTFSMATDKHVDSATGIFYESSLKRLNNNEASMGFDYVFVNDDGYESTIKIGILDKENTQLSISEPIMIPMRRSHHTIIRGKFLMSEASGGVSINPEYDGDHNLIFP